MSALFPGMEVIVIVLMVATMALFLARYALKHIGVDILCLVTGLATFALLIQDTSVPENQIIIIGLPVILCILACACYIGLDTKRF